MTVRSARRPRVVMVTKNDLLGLLNEDFARECRSIYAHAVYAERLRDENPAVSAAIEQRGKREVFFALALCQIIYDYGGTVEKPGDEVNFVLNADRVADPAWPAQTISPAAPADRPAPRGRRTGTGEAHAAHPRREACRARFGESFHFATSAPGHTRSLNRSTGSFAVQAMPRSKSTRNSGSSNDHE